MKKIVLSLLTLLPIICQAQYGNVWAFGYHYGLDFNSGAPVFYDSLSINTAKGSASICDSSGHLLFYTDGRRVWNRLNEMMPNGDSMAFAVVIYIDPNSFDSAYFTAHQPAVIIPIENTTKYYIFTTDFYGAFNQLKYHIVDMAANSGLGDVILKNQILQTDISERLTTTRHCNGQDSWVISRKRNSDEYFSILVKPDTIINTPVISHTGVNNVSIDCCGFTKISPNGKWLATSYEIYGGLELARFDNSTGQIDVLLQDFLNDGWKSNIGCTFSSDSKMLYSATQFQDSANFDTLTGDFNHDFFIDRYLLSSNDSLQIMQSKTSLIQRDSIGFWSALQLGPDGNVYAMGHITDTTVYPQHLRDQIFYVKPGIDSTFATPFIFQNLPAGSSIGLPSFPDAIFTNHHKASLRIPICIAGVFDSIPFYDSLLTTTRDYIWDFGDPASGVNNTFDGQFPIHSFSAPGTYTVTLTLPSDCNPITITQQVIANPTSAITPIITLNNIYLESTPAAQYQWYLNNNLIAGATNQSYTPTANGNYTVTITDSNNCTQTSAVFNLTNVGLQMNNPPYFSIYPNPANQIIQINNPAQKQTVISITDLVGNVIIKTNISKATESINIAQLSNGIYLITIDDIFNQKLVVNH